MAATTSRTQGVDYADLRGYLELLESAGLLKRVTAPVDLEHEIGAICARSIDRGGAGILFENVKGYPGMPLVANILSTTEQLAIAFGTEPDEDSIYERVVDGMEHRVASVVCDGGPCKEVILQGDDVDIYKFPTPWWHELDGGQFIGTTAGVITRDPHTGVHNMGSYRVMIVDRDTLTVNARGPHPVGGDGSPPRGGDIGAAEHILENERRGLPTPIAIAMGMDPLLTLGSGSSVPADGNGHTEYEAAGAWRSSPTELVKCETSNLLVPANAEIIIEGEVEPGARGPEGPHGESTGFYGDNPAAFVVKVKCITHRRNPITYGLICRILEDYPRTVLRSGAFQTKLIQATGLTSIRQAYLPEIGRLGMVVISAEIRDAEEPRRIMQAAWENGGARWVIVVDDDCDVRNWNDVMWRVVSAAIPSKHVITGPEPPVGGRERAEDDFVAPPNGLGIDATMRFKDQKFPPVNAVSRELTARVAARWKELGL